MANEFIIKNGFHSKGDSQVTGSINVSNTVFGGGLLIDGNSVLSGSVTVHATTVGSPRIDFENDGTNSPLARITGQSYGGGANGGLDFSYHNGTSLTLAARLRNGNLGIGTTNPSQKLTVEGNISASGFVSASGFIYSDEKLSIPLVDITSSGNFGQIKMGPNKDQVISGYEDQINIDGDNVIRLQADNTISFVAPLITNQSNNSPSEFNFTGSIITTGSLVVSGSIGMALPSASAFKSFGVPGYYKTTISLAADAEIFRDENIRIEYNEAATDQLEGQIYTDPSSGLVDIIYYNDADGSYSTTERNVASGEFDIDAAFTGWIKAELEIYAPNDNNYPYYHISIISRDVTSNEAFAITQKFV